MTRPTVPERRSRLQWDIGPRTERGRSAAAEEAQDLAVLGPASLLLLGEDELAVSDDVVLALGARDGGGVEAVVAQLGRETRGPFVVPASDGAVENLDGHGASLACRRPDT